jgi:hypothetical protein
MKFIRSFRYVREGEIYPVEFSAGDECPEDLIEPARKHNALEQPKKQAPKGKE